MERDEAIARIGALVDESGDGRGRLVVVEAEAGAGKTRLLDHAAKQGRQAGMRVLGARGMPLEAQAPYGIVRQLLDPVLAADAPATRDARLAGLAAPAAVVFDASACVEDPAFSVRYGLVALTAALAGEDPLMVMVDDAHWADAPSLRYLLLLAARLSELPALLVVAHRPPADDEPHHLEQLAVGPGVERLSVGPLAGASIAGLLADALEAPVDPVLVDRVEEVTGGNPFFVVEVARALAGRGRAPTAEQISFVREQVPSAISRSVLLRTAGLGASAHRLAEAVAVLGDRCPEPTAAAFMGTDVDELAAGADALRAAAIFDPGAPLAFLHPLIGAAVRSAIPPSAKRRAHARAAALLLDEGRAPVAVARHLLETDPTGSEATAGLLAQAAAGAMAQGAPDTAVLYTRRALLEARDASTRADLHELLLAATVEAADLDGLAPLGDGPVFDDLVESIMADPERLRRRAGSLATWLAATGRVTEATVLTDRAVEAGTVLGDLRGAVEMEAQLIVLAQLPPPDGLARLERYRGRLASGSREARLVLGLDAWWAALLGRSAGEAAELAAQALGGNHDLSDDLSAAPFQLATLVLARADLLDAAETTAQTIVTIADARASVAAQVTGRYLRAYVGYRRGDLGPAERDVRDAVDLARLRGLLLVIPLMSALLANVLVDRDALGEAEDALVGGAGLGAAPGGYWLGPVRFARGRLRLAQGRPAEAAAELGELARQTDAWGISGYAGTPVGALLARALMAEGGSNGARVSAEAELARARRWGAPSAMAEALCGLGAVAGGEEGVALLREAVQHAEGSPARLVYASALVELGTLLRRERRAEEGRAALRAGLDIARRCGAARLARTAAYELEAGGERAVRHSTIGAWALTASERRVARMAAQGMTNREIAAARCVSIKTVESHLRAAYDKLGIAARGALPAALEGGGTAARGPR